MGHLIPGLELCRHWGLELCRPSFYYGLQLCRHSFFKGWKFVDTPFRGTGKKKKKIRLLLCTFGSQFEPLPQKSLLSQPDRPFHNLRPSWSCLNSSKLIIAEYRGLRNCERLGRELISLICVSKAALTWANKTFFNCSNSRSVWSNHGRICSNKVTEVCKCSYLFAK